MASEGGKTVGEADPEVSEAVDFARYYAGSAEDLDDLALAEGLEHSASRVVLVTPPWNFPVAIPVGGVLAALAAGSAVVVKPAPATPRCTEIAVDAVRSALAETGAEPDLVQVVRTDEGDVGRHLVSHADVETVLLTGAYETAQLFAGWRADRAGGPRVYAETQRQERARGDTERRLRPRRRRRRALRVRARRAEVLGRVVADPGRLGRHLGPVPAPAGRRRLVAAGRLARATSARRWAP